MYYVLSSPVTCASSLAFFRSAFCFSVAVGGPVILPMIDPSKSMVMVVFIVECTNLAMQKSFKNDSSVE